MGSFTCASCGGTTARDWRAERGWQIVRCERCGLLATWPRPDVATLSELYESRDYYEQWMGTGVQQAWQSRARQILSALPAVDGPLLDFGAGSGGLVRGLRDMGLEADGVEPSTAGRGLARSLFEVDLMPSLEERSRRRYRAIILLHVLEHLPEPRADLEQLRALLMPNGVVFIEVPHAGSAEMWLPSRRRAILDPPAHLHHFTPRTLRTLLESASYEVLDVRLFNVAPVERILSWRAARRESPDSVAGAGSEAVSRPRATSTRSAQAAWAKLLGALRSRVQGHIFQMIATPVRRST